MSVLITDDAPQADRQAETRLIHRWLAFMFLAMMGFVAIVYLLSATFSF